MSAVEGGVKWECLRRWEGDPNTNIKVHTFNSTVPGQWRGGEELTGWSGIVSEGMLQVFLWFRIFVSALVQMQALASTIFSIQFSNIRQFAVLCQNSASKTTSLNSCAFTEQNFSVLIESLLLNHEKNIFLFLFTSLSDFHVFHTLCVTQLQLHHCPIPVQAFCHVLRVWLKVSGGTRGPGAVFWSWLFSFVCS